MRRMTVGWAALGLTLGVLTAAIVPRPVSAGPGDEPPEGFALDGDLQEGAEVFAKRCAQCHGENGDGNGRIKLDPPARDLRDRERMSQRSDWDVYRTIRDGGEVLGLSSKMFPWGPLLEEDELLDVATFVRSMSAPEPAASPEAPSR